jgi:hypothetical protein
MAFIKNGLGPRSGNAVHSQAVIILEALHSALCLFAISTVRGTRQITQFSKPPLKLGHILAPGTNGKRVILG